MAKETRDIQTLAGGAMAEWRAQTPDQQAAFRREFIFAFAMGFLLEMVPNKDGVLASPTEAAVRLKVRDSVRSYHEAHPQTTALELLRKAHEFSATEYAQAAAADETLVPSAEMVNDVRGWVERDHMVDETLARRALEGAGLLPPIAV